MARHIHISRPRMSFADACELVPDDLPDGAYWALAHEIAGLEYGEGFQELLPAEMLMDPAPPRIHPCPTCGRKFAKVASALQHERDAHKKVKP